jgi:hypothetical protein
MTLSHVVVGPLDSLEVMPVAPSPVPAWICSNWLWLVRLLVLLRLLVSSRHLLSLNSARVGSKDIGSGYHGEVRHHGTRGLPCVGHQFVRCRRAMRTGHLARGSRCEIVNANDWSTGHVAKHRNSSGGIVNLADASQAD